MPAAMPRPMSQSAVKPAGGASASPASTVFDIVRDLIDRDQRIAGLYDIPAAEAEGVDAELSRQLVHRGLDGEIALAQAVTAKGAARQRVGVARVAVNLLVGTPVKRDGLADSVKEHPRAVIAVGTRVRKYVHREGRQPAVHPGAEFHGDPHRMAAGGRRKLFLAREFELHRTARLQHCERDDVLGEHLLLAAECAAHPSTEHADPIARQVVESGERVPRQKWRLGARADVKSADLIQPSDSAM